MEKRSKEMITPDDVDDFRKRIDSHVRMAGYSHGVSMKLVNDEKSLLYYLHNIDEFWYSFGKYYPQFGGVGISVAKKELEESMMWNGPCIIVIMMKNREKETRTFYGLEAKEWYNFCENNQMWNTHSNKSLLNGSIPAKMVRNLAK